MQARTLITETPGSLTTLQPPVAPVVVPARPRVLQVITHLGLGGAERVCFTIMRGLGSTFDFDLFAVCGIEPGSVGTQLLTEARQLGVGLYRGTRYPIKYGGMMLAGVRMASCVARSKPDLIHLHTEIPESAYGAMVLFRPKLGGIPVVRTIHNSIYWTPWRRMGRWCERRMPLSRVACVSSPAVEAVLRLREESGVGPLVAAPQVIFNGVEVPPASTAATPRLGDDAARPVRVLFAGRFEQQKGADLLPEIVRRTRLEPGRRVELSIFGSGAHESDLRALAASPPPGWTIRVDAPIPNLAARMPEFDLLLMPSRFEGLSLVAIESLLQQLPVVATHAPGLRDGFPPDYAWLAPPGNAGKYADLLSEVLAHPETWSSVAAHGNAFARSQFNVRGMCDAYARLYRQAIAAAV